MKTILGIGMALVMTGVLMGCGGAEPPQPVPQEMPGEEAQEPAMEAPVLAPHMEPPMEPPLDPPMEPPVAPQEDFQDTTQAEEVDPRREAELILAPVDGLPESWPQAMLNYPDMTVTDVRDAGPGRATRVRIQVGDSAEDVMQHYINVLGEHGYEAKQMGEERLMAIKGQGAQASMVVVTTGTPEEEDGMLTVEIALTQSRQE